MASALGGGLDSAEAGAAGVAAALPPQYVEFKEQIRLEMLGIKQRMGELRSLHGKATLSRFDDTNDDEVQVRTVQAVACGAVQSRAAHRHCALQHSEAQCVAQHMPFTATPRNQGPGGHHHHHHHHTLVRPQVEVLTQQITRMFRKCEARLQQFGSEPSSSEADEKVKRNVQVGG